MFSGKVKLTGISAGILLSSLMVYAQSGKEYSFDAGPAIIDAAVISSDNGLIINYSLPSIIINSLKNDAGDFFRIEATGHYPSQETGKPELPVFSRLIMIPENAGISVKISEVKYKKITPSKGGFKGLLYPRQPSETKNQDKRKTDFFIDRSVYAKRGLIPSDTVRVEMLGRIRNRRLANVYISPVRYNPLKNEIEVITSMRVEIDFSGSKGFYSQTTAESALFNESLDKGLLNYYPSDVITGYSDKPVGMIILTDTSFKKHLKPYIAWKTKKGFRITTLFKGPKFAGSTFTELKDTLAKIYRSATPDNPAPECLLIVGDVNIIPRSEGTTQVSDLYYGEFDGGGDYLPDMYIGRLPVSDTSGVKAVVDKLVQYESFQFADTNKFYNRALIAAGGETDPRYITFMNGQINYATAYYLNQSNNIDAKSIYIPLPSKPDSVIKHWINYGVSFINYTGHGLADQWFKPEPPTKNYTLLISSDVSQLTNRNMYPFIISNACLTAHYNDPGSLGNNMIISAGKGAIGFIGCSNDSYWDEDYYWAVGNKPLSLNPPYSSTSLGAYDRLFHKNNEKPSTWYITMGQVNYAGNLSVSSSTSLKKRYYWETYTLLGDPSLIPFIGTPGAFDLSLPDTIPNGIKTISLTIDPFAYIAISHGDTLWDASFSSPSGSVVLDIPGISDDSCLIVVSGQNKKPLIRKVYISAINKEYINLSSTSINDSGGNNNGAADYGEFINLNVTVSNLGLTAATGLYCKLTTASDWVTIINDSAYVGDLSARSEFSITNGLSLRIKSSIPDKGYITLDLVLKDKVVEKTFKIDIPVHAPIIGILSCVIDDTSTGNGDLIADPGETVKLVFTVSNTGSSNTSGTLSINSYPPGLTVIQPEVPTGIIEYGISVNIPVTVTLSPLLKKGSSLEIGSLLKCDPFTASKNFSIAVGKIRESFEYQSFKIFPWQNSSKYPWIIINGSAYEGQYYARSASISHSSETALKISVNVPVSDTVRFMYKVSSEQDYDFLIFRLNDVQLLKVSGETVWIEKKVVLKEGYNLLEWIYKKDATVSSGSDCAMLDYITFPVLSFNKVDIRAGKIVTPQPNKSYTYEIITAQVINLGTDTLKSYYLGYAINQNPSVYQNFTKKINPADTAVVSFSTAANMQGSGTYIIKVFNSGNNDSYIKNDTSSLVIINTDVGTLPGAEMNIKVMPNPFTGQFSVNINSETGDETLVSLIDATGRKMWEQRLNLLPGDNKITISPSGLNSGYYTLILKGRKTYGIARVIKR
jgi:hypothetical protein